MNKQEEVSEKVMSVYKGSDMSIDEIITNLKHLLSTAKWAQARVNKDT